MAWDRIVDLPRRGLRRAEPDALIPADQARDARQWELAAQLYRKALDRNPHNPPIWIQYGHALKESGELRDSNKLVQAEAAYRRALSLDSSVADAHLQLGHVLKLQAKTEEAQAAYLRAFALDPSMPDALQELSGLGWSEAQIAEFRALVGAVDPEQRLSTSPHPDLLGATRNLYPESRETAAFRPTFSIIIPVHSRTWELREALDSVLIQTLPDLEVIIITNASPPETMAIIEYYIQKDRRVRAFLYPDDSGNACRGRNRGIIEAQGKIISFLDSDDVFFPDTLATVSQIFAEHEVDVVAGRASWIVDGSRAVGGLVTGSTNQPCPINMAVLMRSNPFMTCTVHVRRDSLLEHGGFRVEQEYYEDLELWLRLAYKRCKFYYSDKIFAKYRLHSGNTELKYIENRHHWLEQMRRNYARPFLEWGI